MTIITATHERAQELNLSLVSPAAAAFSRLVTEGAHSQAVNQAREAGLTVGEFRLAVSLSGIPT